MLEDVIIMAASTSDQFEPVSQTSQQSAKPPTPPPQTASVAPKRRWQETNLKYNEEVLATLTNVSQTAMELRSAGEENKLAPLYAGMLDWSPKRQKAMLVRFQCMIAEENIVRFVEKEDHDPRE